MKTNMTENDKRLVFILAIGVIIVAIGYWGILPQVKRFRNLQEKVEIEEEEKAINQLKIANAAAVGIQADDYERKIAERKDEFFQIMDSSEIDRMMTHMALDRNLEVYDLQFSMPKNPTDRMAYQYSELYNKQLELKAEYEASLSGDEPDTSSEDDMMADMDADSKSSKTVSAVSGESKQEVMDEVMGGEEGGYQPNTDIYAVPVTMTVGGDLADLNSFIKDIIDTDSDKRVLLTGYSWGQFREIVKRDSEGNIIGTSGGTGITDENAGVTAEEDSDVTVQVITKKSLTIKLEIYMCDTKDIASDSDATKSGDEASESDDSDGTDNIEE
ncbi:MAG: hypothetical protein K6F55_08635 [Eubacterium sp.]|nr:hypothetical protein [Eubacterium sp.]